MSRLIVACKLGLLAHGSLLENEMIDRAIAEDAMRYIRSSDSPEEREAIRDAAEAAQHINNVNLIGLLN